MKLVFVLLFIFSIVLTSIGNWPAFIMYLILISIPILGSRLSLVHVLKRSLIVIPLVLGISIFLPFTQPGEIISNIYIYSWHITISRDGMLALETILVKAWLSLLGLLWLTSTTRITDLLQSSRKLGFPVVLVMILSFMYRYIFVIVEELMRMKQARDSRSSHRSGLRQLRATGHLIGMLFIRSYERSERVYAAMVSRGYDGSKRIISTSSLKKNDYIIGAGLLLVLMIVGIFNFTGWV